MDLIDKLKELGERISKLKEQVQTEEATKTAFVLPFLSALGYDVFDPSEVVPEFTADLGIKKGEKIDYCVLKDNQPIMIIECKHWKGVLDVHHTQLHRYFHVTAVRFGVLTNGIVYRFYTDLDETNKMDNVPFLEFSIDKVNDTVISELKKFQKSIFDVEGIVNSASDLKYSKQIKELLFKELKEPSEDFVKYFASRIYTGRITQKIQEQFSELVQKSARNLISEMINERLQSALNNEVTMKSQQEPEPEQITEDTENDGVITTAEEEEGFKIIKAIIRQIIPLERVFARDTKSYFGVIIDDNNRKPICRLHFNSGKKYIGIFDTDKKEQKIPIESLDDIYSLADRLLETVSFYLKE